MLYIPAMSVPTKGRATKVSANRRQRYNMNTPKSKFFLHLISHLDFFETLKSAYPPFIYGHSRTIFKHLKK